LKQTDAPRRANPTRDPRLGDSVLLRETTARAHEAVSVPLNGLDFSVPFGECPVKRYASTRAAARSHRFVWAEWYPNVHERRAKAGHVLPTQDFLQISLERALLDFTE
jgi:hypothetical protein